MRRLKQIMVLVQSAMLVLALWPTVPVSAYAAGKQDKGTSATEASADTITVTFKKWRRHLVKDNRVTEQ